jgi:cholinesterase
LTSGFAAGDTAAPYYNGARMAAEQDVIVASVGYRLNIFGFPGAPGLKDYNLGLLDQRLAVEWLRDNIDRFGGDPKRMTLFGESAGGMSVDAYAFAWTKDPIVNGFIAQSGTVFLGQKHLPGNPSWFQVSKAAGCGGMEAGEKTVGCMQRLPSNVLMKSMGSGVSAIGTAMTGFGPTVDNKVVFNNYKARAAAGMFIQKVRNFIIVWFRGDDLLCQKYLALCENVILFTVQQLLGMVELPQSSCSMSIGQNANLLYSHC